MVSNPAQNLLKKRSTSQPLLGLVYLHHHSVFLGIRFCFLMKHGGFQHEKQRIEKKKAGLQASKLATRQFLKQNITIVIQLSELTLLVPFRFRLPELRVLRQVLLRELLLLQQPVLQELQPLQQTCGYDG
jgi:hypothetical protein